MTRESRSDQIHQDIVVATRTMRSQIDRQQSEIDQLRARLAELDNGTELTAGRPMTIDPWADHVGLKHVHVNTASHHR